MSASTPSPGSSATPPTSIRGGKRDAERALVELAADAQRGKLSRTNTTVAELLDAWFDQASQDFSPKTVVETRGFIDRNLKPALGTVPLTRLEASDLDRYYTWAIDLDTLSRYAGQPAVLAPVDE